MRPRRLDGSLTLVLVLLCVLLISACARMPQDQKFIKAEMKEMHPEEKLKGNEGIVFGRLEIHYYDTDGRPVAAENRPTRGALVDVRIVKAENAGWSGSVWEDTSESFSMQFGGRFKGKVLLKSALDIPAIVFARRLPVGEYSIFRILLLGREWYKSDIRFTVRSGQITYVGTLALHLEKIGAGKAFLSQLGGGGSHKAWTETGNDYGEDMEVFRRRYPGLEQEILVAPLEGGLVGRFESSEKPAGE